MRSKFRRSNLPKFAVKGIHFIRLAQTKARNIFPRKRIPHKFTIVAACYNVEEYIDDFFFSLANQTIDPECLEIIAVDDGSTDRTAEKIEYWARRFRGTVRYLYQKNQRQAVARNNGLELASGEWVCFADPDDFVSPDYIEHVYNEVEQEDKRKPISMISCNLIFYWEAKNKPRDNHALRYRFEQKRTVLHASDLKDHMQLSASHAWFRRSIIENHQLRFDEKIVPTFEDGHFVNKLLVSNPDTQVIFLRKPTYYYRKRESATSTIDGSAENEAWYLDQLKFGYLDLLEYAQQTRGEVPRFLQRTVLYDVFWRIKHLAGHPERDGILNETQQAEFFELIERIFSYISCETINTFHLSGCKDKEKVGLLGFKNSDRPRTNVFIQKYDQAKGLFQVSYYSRSSENQLNFRLAGKAEPVRFKSRTACKLFGRVFYYEHFCWVAAGLSQEISAYVRGVSCVIGTKTQVMGVVTTGADIQHSLKPQTIKGANLKRRWRRARRQARSKHIQNRYSNCWLVMDRDDRADDNGEHFYRYLLTSGKAKNAFFVLRSSSPDWPRLKAEGFRLLDFKSRDHIHAYLNAEIIISSDAVESLLHPLPPNTVADRVKAKFVFLQHGVIKDDLSHWLNGKDISIFATATLDEYASIASWESNYKFSEKEVKLTGLCRHDNLLRQPKSAKTILIMPTWRSSLSTKHANKAEKVARDKELRASEFLQLWNELIACPRLHDLANLYGVKIVFSPHPHMLPNLDCFKVSSNVQVSAQAAGGLFQPSFAQAAVLITDYSSVAFEMAYLAKPIIYYQFDREKFFSGTENYQKGYFDYNANGFGPVCSTKSQVLAQLELVLAQKEDNEFEKRRSSVFPFRDGRSCERTYNAVLDLDKPRSSDEKIILKTFTTIPNAGDVASKAIVQQLSTAKFVEVGNEPVQKANLLALGSVLHWSDKRSVVWGSGIISEKFRIRQRPARIYSVRGPISRKFLLEIGSNCPELYGDPGILISDIFPRVEKDLKGVGIVPHYVDRDHPFVMDAKRYGAEIIDPGLSLNMYLSKLRKCEYIISSSLHGIIFAHSYGIPASWVRLTDNVVGEGVKFRDYFMSIGFNPADIPQFGVEDGVGNIVRGAVHPRVEINREDIRTAFDEALQFIFDQNAEVKFTGKNSSYSQATDGVAKRNFLTQSG
jgi:glycosyltransferase involved in cell wall biosynthesis